MVKNMVIHSAFLSDHSPVFRSILNDYQNIKKMIKLLSEDIICIKIEIFYPRTFTISKR